LPGQTNTVEKCGVSAGVNRYLASAVPPVPYFSIGAGLNLGPREEKFRLPPQTWRKALPHPGV
jgi:hypothetical protein